MVSVSLTFKVAFPSLPCTFSISYQFVQPPPVIFHPASAQSSKGICKQAHSIISGCCFLIVFLLTAAQRLRAGNTVMLNMAYTHLIMLFKLVHSQCFH